MSFMWNINKQKFLNTWMHTLEKMCRKLIIIVGRKQQTRIAESMIFVKTYKYNY